MAPGFWGDNFEPVEFNQDLPNWLKRDTAGTDIHILGFRAPKNWELILTASVAQNFFTAIDRGSLVVRVKDFLISSDTLHSIFCNEKIMKVLDSSQDVKLRDFETAAGLYEAYKNPDFEEAGEIVHLNHVKFYMKRRDDASEKRIGLIRDDMFITSEIPYLKRLSGKFDGFDVLIEPVTAEGCELIRDMEPPAHDAINETCIDDVAYKRKATTALKNLAERTKDLLERHFDRTGKIDDGLDAFNDWFTYEADGGDDSEEFDPTGGLKFTRREPPKPSKKDVKNQIEKPELDDDIGPDDGNEDGDVGGAGIGGDGAGDGRSDGPGFGDGEGGAGNSGGSTIDVSKVIKDSTVEIKNFRFLNDGTDRLKLFFDPTVKGKIYLSVCEFGADTQRFVPVKSTTLGEVTQEGLILLEIKSVDRVSIEVETATETRRAIRIAASKI